MEIMKITKRKQVIKLANLNIVMVNVSMSSLPIYDSSIQPSSGWHFEQGCR